MLKVILTMSVCKIYLVRFSVDHATKDIYIYIQYILEVNSQTKHEFYIFIETLQIVSSMCSLQMSM